MIKNNKEIEIKIKITDKAGLIAKVERLGGKKTYESDERDVYFDNDSGFYDSGRVLRIRKEKVGTLFTYKEPQEPGKNLIVRTEIQTYVTDGDAIRKIVESLGFKEKYIKEKKVIYYELDGMQIEFQTVPFLGDFIEIENEEESIKNFLPKLSLDIEMGIPKGYHKLFEEYCKQNNLALDTQFTFEQAASLQK